ncbi:MAG TPA: PHP domain-containing protein, partial [Bryobacteraceae bacterium]|nr:PHP domain-containing protein [Bryobacteraceae bacterium]
TSSTKEMVEHAAQLGYEYIALTDHSPTERVARGLDRGRLEKKIDEVERLRRERSGALPHVLMGAEVDILDDGRLDYPDDILARLDIVVAGVHAGFRQSKERITGRILDAIDNPNVDVLAHPTTRVPGEREPLEFDFEKIVHRAIERGAALEINASIYRLDLNDVMARAAAEAGALIAIGSDAHSEAQLDLIRYGVFQARRGWIESKSVVNTWRWTALSRWLKRSAPAASHVAGKQLHRRKAATA